MENLDIEKLSREMPYKIPDNTFEIMQNNVFEKTLNKKQAPIFNLKWVYAAAAVIFLIIMANFLINSNVKKFKQEPAQLTAKTEIVPPINKVQTLVSSEKEVAQNNVDLQNNDTSDITDTVELSPKPVSQINIKKQIQHNIALAASTKIKINVPTGEQIDSVLDGFSSSEIASLSNNTEQDVYLDLYN
jgi:hypothetical protein